MAKVPVITNLKKPKYLFLFLGVAFIFFDIGYYIMSKLPGSRNEMCVIGVNLTPVNIIFSFCISILSAVMISGLVALFASKLAKNKAAMSSLSGLGFGLGMLTVFCPLCTLGTISVFGLSLGLEFFNDYNFYIKIASITLLAGSLYLLNRQLKGVCGSCECRPVIEN
jgi:hypothetical protein